LAKLKNDQPEPDSDTTADELFEWIENSQASLKSRDDTSLTSPLRTLKAIIWSIDWEITDQILLLLHKELNLLKPYYKEDETVFKFLQLMEAVGKYIKKRKEKSHPESINLLRGLFNELELIVFMMGMSESERNAILQKQIDKFNALKKKLAAARKANKSRKKAAPKKKPPAKQKITEAKTEKKVPENIEKQEIPEDTGIMKNQVSTEFDPESFRQMMREEMRLLIKEEFKKLIAELRRIKENKK